MTAEESRFEQALGRFLDGEPEPEDGPALAAAMAGDAHCADQVRRLLTIDGMLHQAADADPSSFVESISTRLSAEEDGGAFINAVSARLRTTTGAPGSRRRLPRVAVAAACLVAAVSLASIWLAGAPHSRFDAQAAVMVNEANARFADGGAPTGTSFSSGTYDLREGSVHLRFASGAEVVMRAPAKFTIIDRMNMALAQGALRAVVPSSAHGFTVHTSDVRYEDLGTEFGVAVGNQPGESQLHVFEGRVDLKNRQGKLLSSVEVGESVRVAGGKVQSTEPGQLMQFPTAGAIGLEKWLSWRSQLVKDPTLVCYYPFIHDPDNHALLKDHKTSGAPLDGHIEGARWVTGRWPGKQALLFDRAGDHVQVDLPGEFSRLTLAAWIYVDRFDFSLNALFDSDGWHAGSMHCQLSRSGELLFGHFAPKRQRKQLGPRVSAGQWFHVAAVADLERRTMHAYVNGELAEKTRFAAAPGPFTPGSCRIGDWLRHPEYTSVPNRGFRGRMDEIALWGRALAEADIREMVLAGRGSLVSVQ